MLHLLLATLPSLLPQDPPAPVTTPALPSIGSTSPAAWLPESTLAAIVLEPVAGDSAFAALLHGDDGRALTDLVSRTLAPGLQQLGIAANDLGTALQGGAALGFVGFTAGQQPDVVLIAHLGTATDTVAQRLAGLPQRQGLFSLDGGPLPLLAGTRAGHLAIGTGAETVTAALTRAVDGSPASLATERDFVRACGATPGQKPLASVFVRLGDLCTAMVDRLPPAQAAPARRAVDVLGLGELHWAGGSWQLDGDALLSRWQVDATTAEGLLDALAGAAGRVDAGLARFVPANATGYGFFSVQFGTVYDELLALVSAVQPMIGKAFEAQVEQLSQRAGVDVRADLVGGLAGRLITFALPGDEPRFGALLELKQGTTFGRALGKLLETLPAPPQTGTVASVQCWRTKPNPAGLAPAFAVTGNFLAVGANDQTLDVMVRQVRDPRADPQVLAFLRSLPPDASAAMMVPATAMLTPWLGATPPTTGGADAGTRTLIVRRSEGIVIAEERASAAGLLRTATGTLAAMLPAIGTPGTPHGAVPAGGEDPKAVATLREAEAEGMTRANVTAVAALLAHADRTVVARACWLLGEWKAQDAIVMLGDVAHQHADAGVRLQATNALARIGTAATAPALTEATGDADVRVRLCAIQSLGRLGGKVAATAALTMVDRLGSTQPTGAPDDLVAALVVLHDVGNAENLVPAATAVGFAHQQVGQALTFLFQGLSPRQTPKDEVTTLLAVLDHPEPMLRRYAIQRLGELRDPSTSKALEGRLAQESADLQPLIRVSLTQVRGEVDQDEDDLVARAKSNVTAISQMVERKWARLGTTGQIAAAGGAGLLLVLVLGIAIARRRARRNAAVAAAQALVEPSAGFAASGRGTRYQPERETVGAGRDY